MKIKNQLKWYIEKCGLLPLVRFLMHSLNEIKTIPQAFIFYLFNYWLTFLPIYWVRKFYLQKMMGIKIGKQSFIHMGCIFYTNVKIGNNSVIGRQCHLLGDITIKDNVSITAQTYIFASSHYKDSPIFETYCSPVVIEDYAWVGARAMILPGVRIGKGAILGAASTATKSIADYSISVGSPAKHVGNRSQKLDYNLVYFPYFQ
jgi:acetyltransferase-like isoleucine patch superfamily enzyme